MSMQAGANRSVPERHATTVFMLLRRASWRIGLVSVFVVGSVLTAATGLLLHLGTQRSLDLQARSLAYAVEAAVVFRDDEAIRALLRNQLLIEPIAAASVALPQPDEVARQRPVGPQRADYVYVSQSANGRPLAAALAWLWPVTAYAPVVAHGAVQGEVRLQADASLLLRLLAWSGAGVLLAMAVAGVAVLRVSRQLADSLVIPLHALAQHTRQVRQHREGRRTAPRSGVDELDRLSADFDALLEDLTAREQQIQRQHSDLLTAHNRLGLQMQKDGLTGVATRLHFEACLALALEQTQADRDSLSLYFVDADNFKIINDEHGHDAGDRVLEAIARRLHTRVRGQDLVGRLGGDEFVVLVHGQRQDPHSPSLQEQLHDAVAQPLTLPDGTQIVPEVSIGSATYPKDGLSVAELIKAADQDMYRNKRSRLGRPTNRGAL